MKKHFLAFSICRVSGFLWRFLLNELEDAEAAMLVNTLVITLMESLLKVA